MWQLAKHVLSEAGSRPVTGQYLALWFFSSCVCSGPKACSHSRTTAWLSSRSVWSEECLGMKQRRSGQNRQVQMMDFIYHYR